MRTILTLLLATTPLAVSAQAPSTDTMKRVVAQLSSDAFQGRAPGTAGEEKTVKLLVDEFSRLGLEPGNNGSWTQDVPLVEITT
ncbi:MAG: peptidase M28, partial [Alphaproteobacteria bacterium]